MKQTQVGVHPLLSVTVMAGILGLAGYVPIVASAETTGLAGFAQAADQQVASPGDSVTLDPTHAVAVGQTATMLAKVETKSEGASLAGPHRQRGVRAHGQDGRRSSDGARYAAPPIRAAPVPTGHRPCPLITSAVRVSSRQGAVGVGSRTACRTYH